MSVLKTSLRSFFAHKWRMVLSGMAVVLSVAFVCGTLVFTATMNTTFNALFSVTASNVMIAPAGQDGDAEMEGGGAVTGRPETIPGALVEDVSAIDGVDQVTGVVASTSAVVVDDRNESISPSTGAPTIVSNWSEIDTRSMEVVEGSPPEGDGQVMVDLDTADNNDLALGDDLRLVTAFGDFSVTVSGIAEFEVTNPGAAIFYTDMPRAQEYLLGGTDELTNIYVDSDGRITDEALKGDIAAALGADTYKLQTADEYIEENQDAIGEVLSILEYILLGFAGLALLVGIFLIVNTFSMLVAQRTREIGLMRAIGSSRRQVNRSVLIEALLLGTIASLVGFGVGIGLAVGLMAVMSALGLNLSTEDLTIDWWVPLVGVVLGVLVTVIAAYIPARRAGKISPMAALRDPGMPGDIRAGRIRAGIGATLTVIGLASLLGTATTDDSVGASGLLALGILASLLGLVLVGPALVGLVVRALSVVLLRMFGPVGRLAERNALRNPRRTGATASALMIGLALVAGLSVVGSSMVASATDEIDNALGADYIIQTGNFTPVLPEVSRAIDEAVEGLGEVAPVHQMEGEIEAADGSTEEIWLGASPSSYADAVEMNVAEGDFTDVYEGDAVSVAADWAETAGVGVGDEVTLTFDGGDAAALTVAAVVNTGATMSSAWNVSLETMESHVPEERRALPFVVFATAADGQQEATRAALETAMEPYPQMDVRDQAEYKDLIQSQVGILLNMVYGLLALAIIVAILGVVNTLALSVIERTREIGLTRAIGLSRLQLRAMICMESIVIALFGALVGLGLGMVWGLSGQQILAMEGMEVLEIPWGTIIFVFFGAAVVGLFAALIPAFRAGRMNVLNAIATE
ncbi:ABC transporter permease [Streptomyces radicis]|uniref:FtsX-like permease family protein n=1 Tax=Streptomyces radicis TaxID=1750517 RepID=A0A3A9WR37_9ACTN|nr:FtsX-like permease family protein [Streptomyces radicis]RKN08667.1 FtsX-like permease family protein [Streptomyces radicis]RKN21825.1 FtsX-like permease family protein [Streptomyces radicis]